MITSDKHYKTNLPNNFLIDIDDFVETNDGIFLPPRSSSIIYNDGDTSENKIFEILKKTENKSVFSMELQENIVDWPSEYHFSPNRSLLLRHLPINEGDEVLELGSGCGAITRHLCEKGCLVTAVEGSQRRAIITKERCIEYDNLSVYAANFEEMSFRKKYDWILLIGVLEYAGIYSHSDNPYSSLLNKAKELLKPSGKLIIAIENKLGLKYFGGCREDHIARKYFGIENRYSSNTARTFGKLELISIINNAGFSNIICQYPFPDYKLPEVIITDSGMKSKKFLAYELIRHLKSRDYGGNTHTDFDESLVWPQLWENNVLQELSNSFLMIAEKVPTNNLNEGLLAIVYKLNRNPEYSVSTYFRELENNIIVENTCLNNNENNIKGPFSLSTNCSPYIMEKSIHSKVIESISRNDSHQIEIFLSNWCEIVKNKTKSSQFNIMDTIYVSGKFFDLNPNNIQISKNNCVSINLNWNVDLEIPISIIILRYLRRHLNNGENNEFGCDPNLLNKFLKIIYKYLSYPITTSDLHIEEIFNDIIESYINTANSEHSIKIKIIKQKIYHIGRKYDEDSEIKDKIKFLFSCSLMLKDWELAFEAAIAASLNLMDNKLIDSMNEYVLKFSDGDNEALKAYEYVGLKILTKRYLKNNNHKSAINSMEIFIEKHSDHAHAHNDLGILYYEIGNSDKALLEYEKAVNLDNSNLTFMKNLADLYCVAFQRIDEALLLYNLVLRICPDDLEAKEAIDYITYNSSINCQTSIQHSASN